MKIGFDIWWHRIIIIFITALIISVVMFIIKEKPFSEDGRKSVPALEDDHYDPPGTEPHED